MFVYVGGESDEWVEDALADAQNKDMKVVNLMDVLGDSVKVEELKEGMQESEHEHDHEHEEDDDHDEDKDHEHEEDEKSDDGGNGAFRVRLRSRGGDRFVRAADRRKGERR